MNKIFKGFILSLMLLATITFFVARLEATYSKRVEYAGVSCNAGETITVGDLVCIKDADGEAYKADVDSSATRPAVGVAITAGSDGTSIRIMTAGIMAGWSSLAEGSMGYASSTAGTITTNDPNSDYTVIFPDVSGYITVFSNVNTPDVNLIFEGATANGYETTITVTDPTADRTITLPNETAAVMMSSLATNGTDIVNSVTGGTNTLVFEGSTANDYETTITVTDPTADRAITIPTASSGYLMVQSINTHAETASVDANELYGGVLTNNGSIGSIVLSL